MKPAVWTEVGRIYCDALERPGPSREAFVRAACTGNPEVREEVLRLLQAEPPPATFMSSPGSEAGPSDTVRPGEVAPLDRVRRIALNSRRVRRRIVAGESFGSELSGAPLEAELRLSSVDALALAASVERLMERDPQMARAVELRFFGGMSAAETARYLAMARSKFDRRWAFVRTWMHEDLR